ncbi:tRNA 2'-phosphotransferase [Dipsacomyces acuminosporus]|nr:tRNA 2'-phosphotransferase [Dipsacomyces acuminosporus]
MSSGGSGAAKQKAGDGRNNRSRHGQNDSPEVKLSKFLSYVLRHGATKEGLELREDGSILLSELMKHRKLQSTTFAQIRHVVDTNDKKRYTLFQEANEWYIRATQGHSIKIREPPLAKLTKETMPKEIIHGTSKSKIQLIQETGLSRMDRTHIHFATGLANDEKVISGMRKNSSAFIYIDIEKALSDGIEFFISENGVVLSNGLDGSGIIPAKYFAKVVLRD